MENKLIGKTIIGMSLTEDKKTLLFITNAGELIARAADTCCSDTWIENIELPVMGFPAKVISVENLDMPEFGSKEKYNIVTYYRCKIVTDKGNIVIDYRNLSTGHYGGKSFNLYRSFRAYR